MKKITGKRRDLRKVAGTVLCMLLLAALLLTACSGNEKTAESSEPSDSSAKEATAEKSEADDDPTVEAVFFDVGKGDCILFTAGNSHVLLDTGYEETAGEILKELKERDVTSLDAMIITHYDKDHVGGAAEIASEIPVGTFYLPDYIGEADKCGDLLALIEKENLVSVRVSEKETFQAGTAEFIVNPALVSYDTALENDNDASLIVEVYNGEDQWLLPGDVERDAIEAWLDEVDAEYDILKYPHHGKKEKNTSDFISGVSPEITVITDSEEEDASKKVLKMLEEEGVQVYRTSKNGTVTITGDGTGEFEVMSEK